MSEKLNQDESFELEGKWRLYGSKVIKSDQEFVGILAYNADKKKMTLRVFLDVEKLRVMPTLWTTPIRFYGVSENQYVYHKKQVTKRPNHYGLKLLELFTSSYLLFWVNKIKKS